MTTAARVLQLAAAEVGYVEGRRNRNRYAALAGHADHQPWCATFVVAMFRAAGLRLPSESAYTPTMANGFKAAGRWTRTPEVGAVVFFRWPELGRIAHVGLVEAVLPDGRLQTIEGNTNRAGSRTGGEVMRKHRVTRHVPGYGLPAYSPTPQLEDEDDAMLKPGDQGRAVQLLQLCLVEEARRAGRPNPLPRFGPDGDYGPEMAAAVRRYQDAAQVAATGAVDGVTAALLLRYAPA